MFAARSVHTGQKPRNRRMPRQAAWAGIVGASAALALFAGCGIKAPEAPSWDTTVNVPFQPDTTTVQEIVDRTAALATSNGEVSYHISSTLPTTTVGSSLTLNRFDAPAVSTTLDTFDITAPAQINHTLGLAEISPIPISGQSSSVALPSFAFASDNRVVSLAGNGFQTAQVTHAPLSITLTNQLGLAVDQITVTVRDQGTGTQLFSWSPAGTLASGGVLSNTVAIPSAPGTRATIGQTLLLDVAGHVNGGTVSVGTNELLVNGTFASGIKAVQATAQLPAQTFSRTIANTFTSSGTVTAARFSAGTLQLTARNQSALSGSMDLTIRELSSPSTGQPYVAHLNVPASGSAVASIPLSGLDYTSLVPNLFTVDVAAHTSQTSGSVSVQSSDAVSVSASGSGMVLESVTGVIDSTRVSLADQTINVDVPSGLNNVSLPRAKATLTLHTTAQLPGTVQLWVTGYDAHGAAFTLTQNGTNLPPVTMAITPGVGGTLVLDETNSNLAAFVSHLPTHIVVSGSALIGDGHTSGSVSQSDAVSGDLRLDVPVSLSVTSPVTLAGTVDTVTISSDTREQLQKRVQSVHLLADVTNGLPLGASVTVSVSRTRQGAVDSLAVSGQTIVLHGSVAGATSSPHVAGHSTIDLAVEGGDIAVLTQPNVFVATYLHLPATPGTVSVFPTDAVVVQARIQAQARISQ